MKDVQIIDLTNHDVYDNGAIRRRVALRIDGEDKDVTNLRLDSDVSRSRQAKRWSKTFGLDQDDLEERLRRFAVSETARSQAPQAEPDPPRRNFTPRTLSEVSPVYQRWLASLDTDLLAVVFGSVFAHRLEGDPVWLFIVGAPSDGKTEVLRSLTDHGSVTITAIHRCCRSWMTRCL